MVSGGLRAATLISLLETRSPILIIHLLSISICCVNCVLVEGGGAKHCWKVFNTLAVS